MIQERLTEGWRFRHPQRAEWYSASVPGGVHLDLLHHHLIADPFHGTNESHVQWIGKVDWEYALTFEVPAELRAMPHVDLVFDGLDTYATVLLNGTPVLDANNMFRSWRVDVSAALAPGPNELQVRFRSPITEALPLKAGASAMSCRRPTTSARRRARSRASRRLISGGTGGRASSPPGSGATSGSRPTAPPASPTSSSNSVS